MKIKLFTLFLTLVASIGTMLAGGTKIGALYYNFDATNLTAEVTYQYYSNNNYSGLTSIAIPSTITYNAQNYSVTSIGNEAFSGCSGLTSIEMPNSVTNIGSYAFHGCTALTSIEIPNSVASIGDEAFRNCSSLAFIFVGSENVNYDSRDKCNAIIETATNTLIAGCKNTIIPNSVTSIGNSAFFNCSSLTSIEIPNSVTNIGRYAFYGCSGLTCIEIPNSVTNIGFEAFRNCSNLTNVTIPYSIAKIEAGAFSFCTSITRIFVENGNSVYDSRNNCNAIIKTATNTLVTGCKNTNIPNSVTSIGNEAFFGCSGLTSIEIPNSVTSIRYNAFDNCTGLTSIEIPNSVTNIGQSAFSGCTGLTSIYNYATTPQTITSDVYYNVDKATCKLYVPLGSIDLYEAADGWKDFENILPISAEETETTETTVETSDTSAEIVWPKVNGAYTYELVIKDMNGNVVCTLVFDAEGHLTSIAFNAPSRDRAPQQTQTTGFAFTVNGLTSGTTYSYSLIAKDENGQVLNTETGTFTTTGEAPQGIEDVPADINGAQKFIRDGQIFILRVDKVYTVIGQEVK